MWLRQDLVLILGPFDSFPSGPLNMTAAHSEGTIILAAALTLSNVYPMPAPDESTR